MTARPEHAGPQGTLADEVGFLFAALNRAEFEVLSASPSHFFAFDVDIEGTGPFGADRDAWNARVAQIGPQLASAGVTVSYEVIETNCHSAGAMGWCAVQYTATASSGDTSSWHLSLVYEMIAGGWTIAHLHSSPGASAP